MQAKSKWHYSSTTRQDMVGRRATCWIKRSIRQGIVKSVTGPEKGLLSFEWPAGVSRTRCLLQRNFQGHMPQRRNSSQKKIDSSEKGQRALEWAGLTRWQGSFAWSVGHWPGHRLIPIRQMMRSFWRSKSDARTFAGSVQVVFRSKWERGWEKRRLQRGRRIGEKDKKRRKAMGWLEQSTSCAGTSWVYEVANRGAYVS